jgi:hypothetical protein
LETEKPHATIRLCRRRRRQEGRQPDDTIGAAVAPVCTQPNRASLSEHGIRQRTDIPNGASRASQHRGRSGPRLTRRRSPCITSVMQHSPGKESADSLSSSPARTACADHCSRMRAIAQTAARRLPILHKTVDDFSDACASAGSACHGLRRMTNVSTAPQRESRAHGEVQKS